MGCPGREKRLLYRGKEKDQTDEQLNNLKPEKEQVAEKRIA